MSLPHLILGLLNEHPMSGYDLNKVFQNTVQHFWSTEQSQIYRALHRMTGGGWVRVEDVIQTDNPNKKVYHVTEHGHAELLRWLTTPLSDYRPHEAWVGQLFFNHILPREQVIDLLAARIKTVSQFLHTLEAIRAGVDALPEIDHDSEDYLRRMLNLDYGITMMQAELAWTQQQHRLLSQMRTP